MTAPAHVLVIGVDGARYDTLLEVDTPSIDRIAAEGFLQSVQVDGSSATISGPCWATMVTGVLAPVHNIFDNDLTSNRLAANPDFISVTKAAYPKINTFAGADWEPLVTSHSGGPLFAGGGFVPDCLRGKDSESADWHLSDQLVTDRAAEYLRTLDSSLGSASFVYLHGCDTAGHQTGVGDCYREFIAASDRRIGQLLAVIDARPQRAEEEWAIIVSTDHGHRDLGGHGGDSPAERTAWIAASGSGVPRSWEEQSLEQADVAGHAFHVLGLTPWSDDFVGRPFGGRTTGSV